MLEFGRVITYFVGPLRLESNIRRSQSWTMLTPAIQKLVSTCNKRCQPLHRSEILIRPMYRILPCELLSKMDTVCLYLLSFWFSGYIYKYYGNPFQCIHSLIKEIITPQTSLELLSLLWNPTNLCTY